MFLLVPLAVLFLAVVSDANPPIEVLPPKERRPSRTLEQILGHPVARPPGP